MKRVSCLVVFFALVGVSSAAYADDSYIIRWRFPKGAVYAYDYKQEVRVSAGGHMAAGAPAGGGESVISSQGTLTVTCNDVDARVNIETGITHAVFGGHELSKEQKEVLSPPYEAAMAQDGSLARGNALSGGGMQPMADLIFPMPDKPLDMKGPVEQEIVRHVQGMPDWKGRAVYTMTGTQVVNGINCVAYRVSVVLTNEPDEASGSKLRMTVAAEYECLFSPEGGYFMSVMGEDDLKADTAFGNMTSKEGSMPLGLPLVQRHKSSLRLRAGKK